MPRIECGIGDLDAESIGELRAGQQRIGINRGCDFLNGHGNTSLRASNRNRKSSSVA